MKFTEASNNELVVKIQRYKTMFWDFSNNFQGLIGVLFVPLMLIVVWHKSGSMTEFSHTLIIDFTASFILLVGNLIYVFFNQKHNLYDVNSYIFNRHNDSLSAQMVSIWGSQDVCELCSLSEIINISLEIFTEPSPENLTLNQPETGSKVSYQVKVKLSSGIERTIEYNSISVFSDSKTHDEFRSLITQTENVVKEIFAFLEI